MNIIDFRKICFDKHNRAYFLRVQPDDLKDTLSQIFYVLSNLSWISNFDEDYIRESFQERAKATLADIYAKITTSSTDEVSSDAGEYVVSELAREAIVDKLGYLDIPLAELYNKKKSGNPGFDFHSQSLDEVIIFGEAKYLDDRNAYGSGLKQVVRFISDKKDIKDLADLRDFCSQNALSSVSKGMKGFAVAFSAKSTPSDTLVSNIIYKRGTKAPDVDYDRIVFDTYDYLDKLISFKLSDIFYAIFSEYYKRTNDIRALKMAQYFKYGTDNENEIWMLRYGLSFEDIEILKPYIVSIGQEEIVFSADIQNLSPEQIKPVKRYL